MGTHSLTARATDSAGGQTTSATRTITVSAANLPPTVSLTAPLNNASVQAPTDVILQATASAPETNDSVTKVEFYQGNTLIGTATASPWQVTWAKPAAGVYALTAKATDGQGASTTSAARTLTVLAAPQQKLYYLHTDHLNTPRLVTDETNKVVWRNSPLTEPFGLSPVEDDPDGDGTPFTLNLRFPGQTFDKETNTNYNYFRDYSPQTGRYLQSDPIGLAGGINTYGYVGGNPMSRTDPNGLRWVCSSTGFMTICKWVSDDVPLIPPAAPPRIPAIDICPPSMPMCMLRRLVDICTKVDEKDKALCDKWYEEDSDKCHEQYGNGLRGSGFDSALGGCLRHAEWRRNACYKGEPDPGPFNGNGWSGGRNR